MKNHGCKRLNLLRKYSAVVPYGNAPFFVDQIFNIFLQKENQILDLKVGIYWKYWKQGIIGNIRNIEKIGNIRNIDNIINKHN